MFEVVEVFKIEKEEDFLILKKAVGERIEEENELDYLDIQNNVKVENYFFSKVKV